MAVTATQGPAEAQSAWIERIVQRYHHPRFIAPDPLQVVRTYDDPADREVIGLVAASLAYGNVKAILGGVAEAQRLMGADPAAWLAEATAAQIRRRFARYRYRVTAGRTLAGLLIGAGAVRAEFGALGTALAFEVGTATADCDVKCGMDQSWLNAVDAWVRRIEAGAGVALDHLLPRPARRSACKRLFLYLRWMVRRDVIDPGGWPLDPARLIAPIDTHMHRVGLALGWTTRRTADLATAIEVTGALRRLDPTDPLRYDFALTRPGIRKELLVYPS